ncbi:MAG: hypothetical protein WC517_03495 [Patescibacteria group bacterium]
MNQNKLFSAKNALTVGFIALLIALAAFSFSIWQTPNYKSTAKLLAVFNQSNIDTYTASKTANYITGILSEVAYSDSFINSVYESDANLIDNLGQGSEKRQKNWKKTVKTKILDNKGIIIIDVYGNDQRQVNLLAAAIGNTVISQHGLYDGSQDRVAIKMIDTPSIYEGWSSLKVISDTGLGLLAGLLIGFTLIIIFPNHGLFEFKNKERKNKLSNGFSQSTGQLAVDTTADIKQSVIATPSKIEGSRPIIDLPTDASAAKASNPWLNQYYEENLQDSFNRNDN